MNVKMSAMFNSITCGVALFVLTINLVVIVAINLRVEHLHDNVKLEQIFSSFVKQFDKPYNSSIRDVYSIRKEILKQNMMKTFKLNRSQIRGTAKFGLNILADRTQPEFKSLLGYRPRLAQNSAQDDGLDFEVLFNQILKEENKTEDELLYSLPDSFDWRQQDAVSDVKDQGSECGSCWSFAATGSIEGQYKVQRNEIVSLSEQELIDCDTVDQGCKGGLPELAYKQVMELGGLETEQDYPYEGRNDVCKLKRNLTRYSIDNFTRLTQLNEAKMKIWLAKRGPISVAIDAGSISSYLSGVYYPNKDECSSDINSLNHAVLVVGYGIDKHHEPGFPYWLVKNSWGKKWGEAGYFRLFRGINACGIANDPTTALLLSSTDRAVKLD